MTIKLDKEEAVFTLRKNKLDLEHEALLQDRNVILITEFGVPFSLGNILVTLKPDMTIVVGAVIIGAIFLGVIEFFRRRNDQAVRDKRKEIDAYIRKIERSKGTNLPKP